MNDRYSDKLAETIMRRYPQADTYPYCSWSYPQGFMLWGFIRLYEQTSQQAYYDYVMAYCEQHVSEDGAVSGFTGASLDDVMTGSVLVWAYRQTGAEKYLLACRRIRRAFDDYPRNADGGFWHARGLEGEMWVDGLFMGQMFLIRYGAYIEDRDYCFQEAVRQLTICFERCEKDGTGLLYHAYSARPYTPWAHPVSGKSQEVWSEGLGWYAMILADVLGILPKDYPGYDTVLGILRKLLAALAKVQDPNSGLWFQVVDKLWEPHNWHDTSGSAMFLYTFQKAKLLGLLETGAFDDIIAKAFQGLKTKLAVDLAGNANIYDACDGLGVQINYNAYVGFVKNVNAKEAVAAFLWAAAAMEYEGV